MDILVIWILIAIAANAYFSAMETAYTSFDKIVSRGWSKTEILGAKTVAFFAGHSDRFLGTTLIGNNATNTAYASLLVIWAERQHIGEAWIMIASPIIALIFTDLIPKILAHALANLLVRFLSIPLRIFYYLFQPIFWLLNPILIWSRSARKRQTASFMHKKASAQFLRKELDHILAEAEAEGTVTEEEGMILARYLQARDVRARDIMTPRTELVAVPKGAPVSEAIALFRKHGHAVLPVYDENLDNIIGFVRSRDFLIPRNSLEEVIHPKLIIPESKDIIDLLQQFKTHPLHAAIVVDEHGGTDGIVTLKDIIRELVGPVAEQWDPSRVLIKRVAPGRFLVSGAVTIEEVADVTGWQPPGGDYNTVSGLISDVEGRIPHAGDEIDFNEVTIRVVSSTQRRVETCLIKFKEHSSRVKRQQKET